ncbi:MAG: DUF2071 domain-containing protein [Planctomycetes bacterium]|nr:DUF2071 domain-containing protein [Planctomycetota bacterium]
MPRFLTAEWRNLVMLNYEIDAARLLPFLPGGVEVDAWNGQYFISVVGFQFLRTRVLGVPVPFHCNFVEVNLRFYVRRRAHDGWRRGVVFVRELVPRWAIAFVARRVYNENYLSCRMSHEVRLPESGQTGLVRYGWAGGHAVMAEFSGLPESAPPGSEEEFITEHYWGYARQRDGGTVEYRVEHPSWRVWRATTARLEGNVPAFYGNGFQEALRQPPSSAFIADGSAILVQRGVRLDGPG